MRAGRTWRGEEQQAKAPHGCVLNIAHACNTTTPFPPVCQDSAGYDIFLRDSPGGDDTPPLPPHSVHIFPLRTGFFGHV